MNFMKKFLLWITALAVAVATCFMFAACSNYGGDNSVNSEEAWIRAFEDYSAITGYKLVNTVIETGIVPIDGNETDYIHSYYSEISYDGKNYKAHTKASELEQYGNEDPEEIDFFEGYVGVLGRNYITYEYTDDGVWSINVDEYDSTDEAKQALEVSKGITLFVGIYLLEKYKGISGDQEVIGTLAELYNMFSYNSKTHIYTATLKPEYRDYEVSFEISFRDGKLYKIVSEYSTSENNENVFTHIETTTLTYDGVTVNIPAEARGA